MFTRAVRCYPAWDKRNPDPEKNYGVGSVDLVFGLSANRCAVTFTVLTHWALPHVQQEQDAHTLQELRSYYRAELAAELTDLLEGTVIADATAKKAIHELLTALVQAKALWKQNPLAAFYDPARSPFTFLHPMPTDLGYHSPVPTYEGQEALGAQRTAWRDATAEERQLLKAPDVYKMPFLVPTGTFTECEWTGGICYYDGSTSRAGAVFERLLREGDAGVWEELEAYWHATFDGQE